MQKLLGNLLKNRQIVAIIVIVIAGVLLMDLNFRISEYFTVSGQKNKVETQVYGLWSTSESLKTELAYSNSDAAAQKWAREEGKMAQPGDVRVIPIPEAGPTPTPIPILPTPQKSYHYWEYWWALFFE